MFIGEGPGHKKMKKGFHLLDDRSIINQNIGIFEIHRDDIYIANTVKCRPPKNRTPHADEMALVKII